MFVWVIAIKKKIKPVILCLLTQFSAINAKNMYALTTLRELQTKYVLKILMKILNILRCGVAEFVCNKVLESYRKKKEVKSVCIQHVCRYTESTTGSCSICTSLNI